MPNSDLRNFIANTFLIATFQESTFHAQAILTAETSAKTFTTADTADEVAADPYGRTGAADQGGA